MRISEGEIVQVSGVVGFGFTARRGVRNWMVAKGFNTYQDFAAAYIGVPHKGIQLEIERYTFCGELA